MVKSAAEIRREPWNVYINCNKYISPYQMHDIGVAATHMSRTDPSIKDINL